MSGIRVVVVSDRRLSGLALAGAVGSIPSTRVVAEVDHVAEAKRCCERGEADAVLVDASVLVCTEICDHRTAGPGHASLTVPQTLTPRVAELQPAESESARPGSVSPPHEARSGWSFDADLLETLTPREREVFALLGAGLSNTRISIKLGVSEATVKSHVGHVLAKLDLESRLQAGLMALRHQ